MFSLRVVHDVFPSRFHVYRQLTSQPFIEGAVIARIFQGVCISKIQIQLKLNSTI